MTTVAQHGGSQCVGDRREEDACNKQNCPINCVWFSWEFWHSCTKTCGGGRRMRMREKRTEEAHGGEACTGMKRDEQPCAQWQCPINCKWGEWAPWTQCSKSCGGGRRSRDRAVDIESQHGGIQCRGDTQVWEWCRTNPCAADYKEHIQPAALEKEENAEKEEEEEQQQSAPSKAVEAITDVVGQATGQSEEQKKSGNLSLIIIGVAIIMIGGGVFYYQQQQEKKRKDALKAEAMEEDEQDADADMRPPGAGMEDADDEGEGEAEEQGSPPPTLPP